MGFEFIAGGSSQIVSRVETERSAGIYSVDVFLGGPDTTAIDLYGKKMIDLLKPLLVLAEVVDGTKWKTGKVWFVEPEEKIVVRPFCKVATVVFINTDQVKPDEMRSYKDLLNPKWKGKISVEDPMSTGAGRTWPHVSMFRSAKSLSRLYTSIKNRLLRESAGKCRIGWREAPNLSV